MLAAFPSQCLFSRLRYGRELAGFLWNLVRLPMRMLLLILEPVVSFVFGALTLLAVLSTIFYKPIGMAAFPNDDDSLLGHWF